MDELGQVLAHDPGVLERAGLTVAGVDDQLGVRAPGGPQLRARGEGAPAPAGESGLVEQVGEGEGPGDAHDQTPAAAVARCRASWWGTSNRQAIAAPPRRAQPMLAQRSSGVVEVPSAMPWMTATGHRA